MGDLLGLVVLAGIVWLMWSAMDDINASKAYVKELRAQKKESDAHFDKLCREADENERVLKERRAELEEWYQEEMRKIEQRYR